MKTTLGNFLTPQGKDFPVDCELFEAMQNNQAMLAVLGNVAGDKTILYGCELSRDGARRGEGYVFVRTREFPLGEILYFEGGAVQSGMHLKREAVAVAAGEVNYPNAYTVRTLAAGAGEESFSWADFRTPRTNEWHDKYEKEREKSDRERDARIAQLLPTPVGVVQMWAGGVTAKELPANYMLCDGTKLVASQYPELYAAIGRIHKTDVPGGYFCLPDLRARFVAGFKEGDKDYTLGKTGGKDKYTLTESEIPSHTHSVNDYYFIESNQGGIIDGADTLSSKYWGANTGDPDNNQLWYKTHNTKATGGGKAFDIRPPYYTLAYIIKVK